MAEAVSLRKGTYDENKVFSGVKGEVTYDVSHKTLWTHDGDTYNNTGNGTELARADFEYAQVSNLGNNFGDNNLAFANLSNLTPIPDTSVAQAKQALYKLHYMYDDLSNISTAGKNELDNLVGQEFAKISYVNDQIATRVKTDLTNFNTSIAAGETGSLPSGSKPLAYKDLSNINTTSLASGRSGTSGDKNLLYADLTNIPSSIASATLADVHSAGLQTTDKLIDVNNASASAPDEYPTAISVKTKLDSIISLPEINPVESKKQVYATYDYEYQYSYQVVNGGQDYVQGDEIRIGSLLANVESVDINGAITAVFLQTAYGENEIDQSYNAETITGTGSGASFTISSTTIGSGNINWTTLYGFDSSDVLFNNDITGGGKYIEERDDPITDVKGALETLGLNQQDANLITEVMVTDVSGVIRVTTKRAMTANPTVKALVGGATILGSWSTTIDANIRNFTPSDPDDILSNSWIVVL